MSDSFRIAIAGLGTVGAGVVEIIQRNADLLTNRVGRKIEIICVSARDKDKDRGIDLSSYDWLDAAESLADQNNIDAVIELIGGSDGIALDLVKSSLSKGIHVVTANKAMVAHHGLELASLAENNDCSLAYEAAVAGGIPVIKAIREGLAANRIAGVYGILNGTCNYILTQMREGGRDFSDVLAEAQAKGYAEADPAFDIGGVDAGHKICILASIAFGIKPDFGAVKMTGIDHLTSDDIEFATELGYKIKLLGIAKDYNGSYAQTVEPCLVPDSSPLGAIEDVYNAVFIDGDFVETPLFTGLGAGAGPTASSVVADIVDLARGLKIPTFGIQADRLKEPVSMDQGEIEGRYYLRLGVIDKAGVIADISAILRDHDISIESLLQRGRDPGQPVSVVITTHEVRHDKISAACGLISELDSSTKEPCLIRIEEDL